ncbi:MAG: hypothetical protein GX934_02095, partial [Burkholderiales bacterium]|nr:hypothetical protein [Burkholderiales bacterium]
GNEGSSNTTIINRNTVKTQRVTSTSTTYLPPIIRDLGNIITKTVRSTSHRTVTRYASTWRTSMSLQYNGRFDTSSSTSSSTRTWLSFLRAAEREVADRYLYDTYTKTGETFDRTESSESFQDSPDLILIGDVDSLEGGYAAQGTRVKTVDIVDYIWEDMHKDTTRQKVLERWKEYQKNIHVTYTTTRTKYGVTPIVLNMDGTGVLGASAGRWNAPRDIMSGPLAVFDFFGSGEPVLMEWVKPQDGLLVRLKERGPVDGTCLFGSGNGFADGFEELATLDRNRDGRLTGDELDGLFVWQDANGNAIAGISEVKSLADLGITELGLDHQNYESYFVRDGQRFKMWDWHPVVKQLQRVS